MARAVQKITILLCTYNGAAFLPQQLASLRSQTHRNWRLIVSDDGSEDGSREFCEQLINASRLEVRIGPKQGVCRNFLSLITDKHIGGDYFAYCDQDDVWYPDKLERAIAALAKIPSSKPAMYCSRTHVVAADGSHLGFSPFYPRPPGFRNALVENIASGNTIVMNKAARDLFVAAGPLDVVLHDWWSYVLISGAGGIVYYDPVPTLDYRQHANNAVGAARGFGWTRLHNLLGRKYASVNLLNSTALLKCRHLLSPENRSALDAFVSLKSASLPRRVGSFRRAGLYRQTKSGQLWLNAAVALGLV
jgi:glycosyltransferase involved in cell wall biosynthesis